VQSVANGVTPSVRIGYYWFDIRRFRSLAGQCGLRLTCAAAIATTVANRSQRDLLFGWQWGHEVRSKPVV